MTSGPFLIKRKISYWLVRSLLLLLGPNFKEFINMIVNPDQCVPPCNHNPKYKDAIESKVCNFPPLNPYKDEQ